MNWISFTCCFVEFDEADALKKKEEKKKKICPLSNYYQLPICYQS